MNHVFSVAVENQNTRSSYDHMNHTKDKHLKLHMNHMKTVRTEKEVDYMVDQWVQKMNIQPYTPLLRKAAWYLSGTTLTRIAEKSVTAKNPIAYFIGGLKKQLRSNDNK